MSSTTSPTGDANTVTVELLDAMMVTPSSSSTVQCGDGGSSSSIDGQQQRKEAESFYGSLSVTTRCRGLLGNCLLTTKTSSSLDEGRLSLAAVLLRREISNLAGDCLNHQHGVTLAETTSLLHDMVAPLLSLYTTIVDNASLKRALGHCLAELCLSVSLLGVDNNADHDNNNNNTNGGGTLSTILSRIGPSCGTGDATSLTLLSNVASRAPIALWTCVAAHGVDTMGGLLAGAVGACTLDNIRAVLDAVFHVGLASAVTERAASSGGGSAAVAEVENAIYGQIQGGAYTNVVAGEVGNSGIVPGSFASKLGQTCLPPLLSLIVNNTNNEADDALPKLLTQHLTDCVARAPSLLAGDASMLQGVVQACLSLALNNNEDRTEIRLSALEVLASMCESSTFKKTCDVGPMVTPVIAICLSLMVLGVDDDVEAWSNDDLGTSDLNTAYAEDDAANHAENLLERFLHALGGQVTLPLLLPLVQQHLQSPDWRGRRAALAAVERCLLAVPVSFRPHTATAVQAAVFTHEHVRVRWQSLQLAGELCNAGINKEALLPTICWSITSTDDKVAAHACAALVSLCRSDEGEDVKLVLLPSLPQVLQALAATAGGNRTPVVTTRALGAVACVAESVGADFVPYYRDFMPGLIQSVGSAGTDDAVQRLRGTAVEAASIVGRAVCEGGAGLELFAPDAETIMTLALPLLQADEETVPFDQLLAACARIAAVTKARFVPFLPALLPHLLKRGAQRADVEVTEGSQAGLEATQEGAFEETEEGTESVTVAVPGMGLRKLTMNTTQMQEKAQAARAVYELASALGAGFAGSAEACASVFLPLVNFKYSSEVRCTSAQALAPIFHSTCLANATAGHSLPLLRQLLPNIVSSILHQLQQDDEDDMEVTYGYAEALSEVLFSAYDHKLIATVMTLEEAGTYVSQLVTVVIAACLKRRAAYLLVWIGLNEDERQDYQEILDREADLLSQLVNCVGYVLKGFGPAFMPVFDDVVAPAFRPLLLNSGNGSTSADDGARLAAVCLFDDCVEHCGGAAAAKYAPNLLEAILQVLGNGSRSEEEEDENVLGMRTSCIYGLAQIARHAPASVLTPVAVPVLQQLELTVRYHQQSEGDDHKVLVENAVAAIAFMVLLVDAPFQDVHGGIDKAALMNMFLQSLPLEQDDDLAKICHDGLCNLVDAGVIDIKQSPAVLISIIGDTLALVMDGEEVATSETCSRFTLILRKMQEQVDGTVMQSAFESLSPDSKLALQNVL